MGILFELIAAAFSPEILGRSFAAFMVFIFALVALFAVIAWMAFTG